MGTSRTRQRSVTFVDQVNTSVYSGTPSSTRVLIKGGQTTVDENNHWYQWRDVVRSAPWTSVFDNGSAFSTTHYRYRDSNIPHLDAYINTSPKEEFHGWVYPATSSADSASSADRSGWWKAPIWGDPSVLDVYGSTAISRCAPVNPHASLVQTLVELRREGLPSLPGLETLRSSSKHKGIAGDYLNYEFGIKPLVSDIRAISHAIMHAEEILKQYIRDSGRIVRRTYEFPEEIDAKPPVIDHNIWPWQGGLRTRFQGSPYYRYAQITDRRKRWFSGAFTYYADPRVVGEISSFARKAEYLLGANPDIADLYNLAPWSWLADWFTNAGDVINNLKMFTSDGLIMRWGYVMEHQIRIVTYTNTATIQGRRFPAEQQFISERKLRRKANPFGFGLRDEDLSPRQWAILSALGMTQGRRPRSVNTD